MTLPALKDTVARLGLQAGALTAVGLALQERVTQQPLDPRVRTHVDEALDALGIREAIASLSPGELRPVLAEVRMFLVHGATLLGRTGGGTGWRADDPAMIVAAGETSAGFAPALKGGVMPQLDGLAARLDGSGAFLDVGVGVAGLAIAMARLWPTLRVVGIDPLAPALALARENVAAAALVGRIELRQQLGEELPDIDAFDLAWVPSLFIPGPAVDPILRRVFRAMRPGGWVLLALARTDGEPLAAAYARLRTVLWGGVPWTAAEAIGLVTGAGFADARQVDLPPAAPMALVAGRKPA